MTDRCAQCFEPLKPGPSGFGRLACLHPRFVFDQHRRTRVKMVSAGYLSAAVPEAPNTREACIVSRYNKPTLHIYGSMPL